MAHDIFLSSNKRVGKDSPTFVIAEVGQNHQGNIDTAKILIESAKESGADCVKFQKTYLPEKFSKAALERPYINVNSWGETYGSHKEHLEFTDTQFVQLHRFAADIGILFSASAMDLVSLRVLQSMDLPFIKIGSGDSNNLELIEAAAQTHIPLMISTGMLDLDAVTTLYQTVSKYHKKFCLLHCVSAYPAPLEELNLSVIKLYQEKFPDISIGYSGHEVGVDISVAAVALGAKVIERHITLGHNQKGSDHVCSLEPREFKLMVHKIRTLETALGVPMKGLQPSEVPCYEKLRKSIVMARSFRRGHRLSKSDLKVKVSEPRGIDGLFLNDIIGRKIINDIEEDQPLTEEDLE